MSKYFKEEKILKEHQLLVGTVNSARRKVGDFIRIAYVFRGFSDTGLMVGYDFNGKDFSECKQARLLKETREPTKEEILLYKQGKINIYE
jgi:hypothetical protein